MGKNFYTGLLLFLFAFSISLYNFSNSGRWTDEHFYVAKGYVTVDLLKKGQIFNPYFVMEGADHPLTAVYVYGIVSQLDFTKFDPIRKFTEINSPLPLFDYDLPATRLVTIFISSLAVLLTYLFCLRHISYFVAVSSSLILATLPHYVGFSQKVSLESWCTLTFTLAVYYCFEYLKEKKTHQAVMTGIFSGITLTVKQSNILIFSFLGLAFLLNKFIFKDKKLPFKSILIIGLSSLGAIFVTYPMPFFNLETFWETTYEAWFVNGGKIPELIFGEMIGAPFVYYFIAISITTPALILTLLFTGGFEILRKRRTAFYLTLLLWFIVPFFMMFFAARQHMVRYIIQVYVPLAIISAIGLESVTKMIFKDKKLYFLTLIPILLYSLFIIYKTNPYYLTYFNELIGGTERVYKEKLFLLGWHSEGLKSVANFLKQNAEEGSSVGYAVNAGFGAVDQFEGVYHYRYDPNKEYDYVVLTVFEVTRGGFVESSLLSKYKVVFEEKGNGLVVARVFKNRSKVFPVNKLFY